MQGLAVDADPLIDGKGDLGFFMFQRYNGIVDVIAQQLHLGDAGFLVHRNARYRGGQRLCGEIWKRQPHPLPLGKFFRLLRGYKRIVAPSVIQNQLARGGRIVFGRGLGQRLLQFSRLHRCQLFRRIQLLFAVVRRDKVSRCRGIHGRIAAGRVCRVALLGKLLDARRKILLRPGNEQQLILRQLDLGPRGVEAGVVVALQAIQNRVYALLRLVKQRLHVRAAHSLLRTLQQRKLLRQLFRAQPVLRPGFVCKQPRDLSPGGNTLSVIGLIAQHARSLQRNGDLLHGEHSVAEDRIGHGICDRGLRLIIGAQHLYHLHTDVGGRNQQQPPCKKTQPMPFFLFDRSFFHIGKDPFMHYSLHCCQRRAISPTAAGSAFSHTIPSICRNHVN